MTSPPRLPSPVRAATRTGGLTLVELLVALSVFAVLGVLAYRAVSQMSLLDSRIGDTRQRWRDLEHGAHRIERDLLQLAPASDGGASLRLVTLPRGASELQLHVIDGASGRARRVGLRFSRQRIERIDTLLAAAPAAPADLLLDRVARVRWRFLAGGQRFDSWPPPATEPGALPAAVELQLELPDLGLLTRTVALR